MSQALQKHPQSSSTATGGDVPRDRRACRERRVELLSDASIHPVAGSYQFSPSTHPTQFSPYRALSAGARTKEDRR